MATKTKKTSKKTKTIKKTIKWTPKHDLLFTDQITLGGGYDEARGHVPPDGVLTLNAYRTEWRRGEPVVHTSISLTNIDGGEFGQATYSKDMWELDDNLTNIEQVIDLLTDFVKETREAANLPRGEMKVDTGDEDPSNVYPIRKTVA